MSVTYLELLDATIDHLKQLRADGTQFVSVSPEVLNGLSAAPRSKATVAPAAPAKNFPPSPQPSVSTPPQPVAPPPVAKVPVPVSAEMLLEVEAPIKRVPLSPEEKAKEIADLRERALVCQKCPHLVRSRKNVVFGVGDVTSPLMFVGEAPGADEDVQGEPFVGKAGQLLTRIIQTMGFSRETVYIANVLKCRPDTPGQAFGNRKPTPEEMKTCLPYLLSQIETIQPKVLVALGATAYEGLLGKAAPITKVRGRFQEFRGIPLMPTYHPSYLLRNPAPSVKREVWEDMLQVLELLGRPISEKQRNYFKSS